MSRIGSIVAFLFIILITPSLYAGGEIYGGPDKQEEYDACQGTLDPEVCMWSPMGSMGGGMVITACRAENNANCKKCSPFYTWNGTLIGEECAQTRENASCTCTTGGTRGGCSTQGSCTYAGWW
ncbi:MAG TPA: hypothetical protein VJZ00_05175 [Thermoanaerobaculia bacterium]|nr:hypothetical protein [Thermoanaerobaculia bacterium]